MKLLFQEWKHSKCFSTRTLKPRKIVSVYTHREYGCLLLRMILFLLDNHCLCCDFIHSFLISVLNSVWVWPLSLCTELLGGENSTACFSFCRGIFKLLVKFQLENKDNPSYAGAHSHSAFMSPFSSAVCNQFVLCAGLSFQDFYQRCREAFLVNSDLTLRTQLTEFRDHKLIRTRKVDFHFTIPQLSFIKCLQYLGLITFICFASGSRWSRVPDCCCGCKHTDGFPGERRGWLSGRDFRLMNHLFPQMCSSTVTLE